MYPKADSAALFMSFEKLTDGNMRMKRALNAKGRDVLGSMFHYAQSLVLPELCV